MQVLGFIHVKHQNVNICYAVSNHRISHSPKLTDYSRSTKKYELPLFVGSPDAYVTFL